MTRVLGEVRAMQNAALGAGLLWRFVCGYSPQSSTTGMPLPLAFLVLPVVLHARSRAEITGTQVGSGLRKFEEKFGDRGDALFLIQSRMLAMRDLSLRSLRLALRGGLVTLVPKSAVLWPRSLSPAPTEGGKVTEMLKASEKLGEWCADLSLFEIAGILKVEL